MIDPTVTCDYSDHNHESLDAARRCAAREQAQEIHEARHTRSFDPDCGPCVRSAERAEAARWS